jgi:hypothetical protein
VPQEATTFLTEHMTVDVAHNKLMREYVQRLVRTETDLSAVTYAIRVTGHLYGEMLAGAIRSFEKPSAPAIRTVRKTLASIPTLISSAAPLLRYSPLGKFGPTKAENPSGH